MSGAWWLGIAALGLSVGVVAGMFGVGGGFLLTPLLNVFFGVPLDIAVGTGLCQMIGTAVAAFRRHQRLRQGEVKIDWLMMAGGVLGVQLGAGTVSALMGLGRVTVAGHTLPAVKLWLALTYIVVLASVGAWMIHDARTRRPGTPIAPGPLTRWRLGPMIYLPASDRRVGVLTLAYLGLFLGFLSGLMGIGGGVVLMPILIYGIGMRIAMAAGTGILLLVVTSVVGTIAHARMGHVHLALAVVLLAGSTLGAPLGATLTHRWSGQRLRGLFGYLVLLTALAVAWDLVRALRAG